MVTHDNLGPGPEREGVQARCARTARGFAIAQPLLALLVSVALCAVGVVPYALGFGLPVGVAGAATADDVATASGEAPSSDEGASGASAASAEPDGPASAEEAAGPEASPAPRAHGADGQSASGSGEAAEAGAPASSSEGAEAQPESQASGSAPGSPSPGQAPESSGSAAAQARESSSSASAGAGSAGNGARAGRASIETTIRTADKHAYTVTATYDESAGIPENAELSVVEYVQEPDDPDWREDRAYRDRPLASERFHSRAFLDDRAAAVAKCLNVGADDIVRFTKFLRIRVMADGKAVEPAAALEVTIETDAIDPVHADELELAVLSDDEAARADTAASEEGRMTRDGKVARPLDSRNLTEKAEQGASPDDEPVKLRFSTGTFDEFALACVKAADEKPPASAAAEPAASDAGAAQAEPVYEGSAAGMAARSAQPARESAAPADGQGAAASGKRTLSCTAKSLDGTPYDISVTYGPRAGIDDDAALQVRVLSETEYAFYRKSVEKALAGEAPTYTCAFDIEIVDAAGNKVEPKAPVAVSIALADAPPLQEASVVHFGGATPDVIEADAITAQGTSVIDFPASSFSVYVVAGSDTATPRHTYTFYVMEDGLPTAYALTDDEGDTVHHQAVKSIGELVIPQMTSTEDEVFAGWYAGSFASGSLVLEEQPYDFDSVDITEDNAIDLYAVYKRYAYVTFFDQYDATTGAFPVAYTRRAELVPGDGPDTAASATVSIADLSATYTSGDDGANMAFYGWSRTPITTPGAENDDNDMPVAKVETDEDGCIAITGDVELYPIYREIHWLTFYAAQSGKGAGYNAPRYCFVGEGIGSLPTSEWSGYTFKGWSTGSLTTQPDGEEVVQYGTPIADENGALIASANDAGAIVSAGKLYLTADVTLFARWEADTTAGYTVAIWKQRTTDGAGLADDAKTYEYAQSFNLTAPIGATVTVGGEYRGLPYDGYAYSHCDPDAEVASDGSTVLNCYYDMRGAYVPTGETHDLRFVDSNAESPSVMPNAVEGIAYGAPLKGSAPAAPVSARAGYTFSKWFYDPACRFAVDWETLAMPDHDLTVYAGWELNWFIISIDPNHGALYAYDEAGKLDGTGSTWFWSNCEREPVGEYTHTTRDFVESSSGTWYYVNHDASFGESSDRRTYYTQDPSEATEDTTFEYAPGAYSYAGWYEVKPDGTEQPYEFGKHEDHAITLKLHWKKNGSYHLAYAAGDGTLDDGEAKDLVLPQGYSDNASVVLTRSAHAPAGYSFVGWQVRGSDDTRIYLPGQSLSLNADDAIRIGGREIVYLDAVYARVDTATIVYDANGAVVNGATVSPGSIIDAAGNETPATATVSGGRVSVSGLGNNSKFKLGDGTGFSYEAGGTAFRLKGWSTTPAFDGTDASAQFFAPGSTCIVDSSEPKTLYAVWEATATYHLGDVQASWGGSGAGGTWSEPYEYDGASNTHAQAVYLNAAVSEPPYAPSYAGGDNRLFRYWAQGSPDGPRYDFSQPVTGALDLYAHWSEPDTFPVHAVDASAATLVDKTSDSSWGVAPSLTVGTTATSLTASSVAGFATPPEGYEFAFVAAHDPADGIQAISRDEAIEAIVYDSGERRVCVQREGDDAFSALEGAVELYFVYYQKKALDIAYTSMQENGAMVSAHVASQAPSATEALGSCSMGGVVSAPLTLVDSSQGYTHYAFAIGGAGVANANGLTEITNAAGQGEAAPLLSVRDTWRGFEYTTDGDTWVNWGYDPTLYVTYFTSKPTVVTFVEDTVGTSAVKGTAFTFNYAIYTVAREGGAQAKVFDTRDAGNSPIQLKDGEAYSTILFLEGENAQKAVITQDEDESFTTTIDADGESQGPAREYAYTTDGTTSSKRITFTNTHTALPVEVHVALVENDGTNGGIIRRDSLRSQEPGAYSFDLAIGASEKIGEKLPAATLFAGDADRYAFGAVMYGTGAQADGQAVQVGAMGVASVGYEAADDGGYELVLRDAGGQKLAELGGSELYYLYYPKPKIRYVKENLDGTFSAISGSTEDGGVLTSVDGITYNHEPLTMNGLAVAQNQSFEIPLGGFMISQAGNSFRMPPILDDNLYERYLAYARIGAGNENALSANDLAGASDGRTMQLKVQNNTLQYSFDGSAWYDLPLAGTPTIYAIYAERGYDVLVTKTIDMSSSGKDPLFADSTYPVVISSTAITKSSYDAEGAESATVAATPADGIIPGTISLTVGDGTRVKVKGLGQGDYTIVESGNENYELKVSTGRIVGGASSQLAVVDNSRASFGLRAETKVDLVNSPRPLCKIHDNGSDHVFYTLRSAVDYVAENIATGTATIEMLADYLMPAADAVTIPQGLDITIATAEEGFSGAGALSVITRSGQLADAPLFVNGGSLAFRNVVLEGSSVAASEPVIRSAGNLVVGEGAVMRNATSSAPGGAIHATAGDITVSGLLADNRASQGGAIYYSGNGTITVTGNGTLEGNVATEGNGGALYAAGGTIALTGTAKLQGNDAPAGNGGAVYAGSAVVTVDQNATVAENTAQVGGALYVETGSVSVAETDGVSPPRIEKNAATAGDGGAVWVGAGSVSLSGGLLSENTAASGKGGAVYAVSASVRVSGTAQLRENIALEGGAVYAASGAVGVSGGEVASNKATRGDGGAVHAGTGTVTVSGGAVNDNAAEAGSGGAVYAGSGNVTVLGGTVNGNTAGADGGGVYAGGGTVSVSCDSMSGNTATNGSGGGVYAQAGTVTVNGTTLSGNRAGADGGAVYAGTGGVSVTNGRLEDNAASAGSGGGVYAQAGTVTLSGATMTRNAAAQDGGALYAGSGAITMSNSTSMNGNAARGNGGGAYIGSGTATLTGITMSGNKAVNGAAVFVASGKATFNAGSYTANTASAGGALGMGGDAARLTFGQDVKVTGNKLGTGSDAADSNVYLDQDSDNVLIMAGLGAGASIGIYVPDALTAARDVPGARFSSYTNDSNVDKIVDDRFGFSVQEDTVTKKLFWGAPIKVEVRYQSSYQPDFPPSGSSETKYTNSAYYPEFSTAAISELAEELFNKKYLSSLSSTATYGGAFTDSATTFGDYITNLTWDTGSRAWNLVKRDGAEVPLADQTIVIYYAEPAYISIENNTGSVLAVSGLAVGGAGVVNTGSAAGYGMVFAKNGAIRSALLPVTQEDLVLAAGASINLLIPGGRGMAYDFAGSFSAVEGDSVRVRRTGQEESFLSASDAASRFELAGTTLSGEGTYEIIFGDDKQICKIDDGVEHPFSKISSAVDYAVNHGLTTATIEMLTDYLLPASDAVLIPAGYDITLTTAQRQGADYVYSGDGDRATISRDSENTSAMIETASGNVQSSLSLAHLVFDGKSVRGTSDGGAVKATQFRVVADDVDFVNIFAKQGGALYVKDDANSAWGQANSRVEVSDCLFRNCNSTQASGTRVGGGAIHAFASTLVMSRCRFESCDGGDQAGAVFHRVDSDKDSWTTVDGCTFSDCTAQAAGGLELDSKYIEVSNCTFEHCVATNRNGGGFNVYATNAASPAANTGCYVNVTGCTFSDCHADSTSQANYGGGFRSNAIETTVTRSTFSNCSSRNGGGIGISNSNATKAEIQGCTIEECRASTNEGGGVYSAALVTEIGDYTPATGEPVHTSIANCTAKTNGGGVYHFRNADGSKLTMSNVTIQGNTAAGNNGGGVCASDTRTIQVSGAVISDNVAKGSGGGLYGGMSSDSGASLRILNTVISGNTSGSSGGGVWYDSSNNKDNVRNAMAMQVLQESAISSNKSGNLGGGVYTQAKALSVEASSINDNVAANNGGGIYHMRNVDGSLLELTGSHVDGNTASNGAGGGIYSGVRALRAVGSTVSRCTAAKNGGGICFEISNDTSRDFMTLSLQGCDLDGNASGGNGGAVYAVAKTVELSANAESAQTRITNCVASGSGGGVYQARGKPDSTLTVTGSEISGCSANDTATNNAEHGGGGVWSNSYTISVHDSAVSGNSAARNGGGILALSLGDDRYLVVDGSKVSGNTAGNMGGGIYSRSQLALRNEAEVTGNRLSINTAGNAAGVYLENKRTLFVGPEDAAANDTDTVYVKDNYTSAGVDSNLRLWEDNGQNDYRSVRVYCNLSGEIRVVNAKKVGTRFGTSTIEKPDGFSDDAPVFKADGSTLHGIIDRMDESHTHIIWAGKPIAKITDGEGNLLYLKANSTDPAIFDRLSVGNNMDAGTTSAFGMLNSDSPQLFTEAGAPYEGSSYCIKLLVESFTTEASMQLKYVAGRQVSVTTAGSDDADNYPFEGRAGGRATVIRGTGVGNNALLALNGTVTLTNIIFDSGSENGIAANGNTRVINVGDKDANAVVTLGEGATLQNATVKGNGAGAWVSKGTFNVKGGTIRNCAATGDGGGVYSNGGKAVNLDAGNIYQCTAARNGGGVYLRSGALNMSGGMISAGSANQGGGVYVANGKVMNMSGGSIVGNTATSTGGGIAIPSDNGNTRLNFSGRVTVSGNTATKDGNVVACNVELNRNAQNIVNTNNGGLYGGSYIGVYVPGTMDKDNPLNDTLPYRDRGGEKDAFGTFATDDNTSNLYGFVNDRNGLKGGIIENPQPNTIYWVEIFSLQVGKTVVAGDSSVVDPDEEFAFTVTISGTASASGQLDAKDIDSGDEEGKYGEMVFHSDGAAATMARFTLKAGETATAVGLSEGLAYEVVEDLTESQRRRYSSIPATRFTSTIGENKARTDIDPYTSVVQFTNVMPVCKLTDNDGNLLYRRYTTDDGQNVRHYNVPAVYTELTGDDGAFEALKKPLYGSSDANAPSYSTANGVQVQMLIDAYTMTEPAVLPATVPGTVTLTTASASAAQFPYQGTSNVSTVRRGYAGSSLFSVGGNLGFATITIDGVKGDGAATAADSDGGIASVQGGGTLAIRGNATLQNAKTSARGGAVYVSGGGAVTMDGGAVRRNESDGDGAGIYLAEGSTLTMKGAVSFGGRGLDVGGNIAKGNGNYTTGSLTAKNNGGKSYATPRQDIFLAESGVNPASLVLAGDLSGDAGSIWVWAQHASHYAMMKPFAKIGAGALGAGTYAVFRNAQTDDLTLCGSDGFLTGSSGENPAYMYWTGGYDLSFLKVDGFGEALPGAEFTLYRDPECASPYQQGGHAATATSADGTDAFMSAEGTPLAKGTVLFSEVPGGVYYLKETAAPAGYEGAVDAGASGSANRYLVLVGDAALKGAGSGALAGISAEQVEAQAGAGTGASKAAVFLLGADGQALGTPDIARFGIMNVSATRDKAILKKTGEGFAPLGGATFDILRYDRTVIATGQVAQPNGVFWIGTLPHGTYYLHETAVPAGYAALDGTNDNWFSVTVDDAGVHAPERLDAAP